MTIIDAIRDPHLFRPFLADGKGSLATWDAWLAALRAMYGLPIVGASRKVVRGSTGRRVRKLPTRGFSKALFLIGRRGGKGRMAAVIAAFEACLTGREKKLAPGEIGMVVVVSPTKRQSRIVHGYIRAVFDGLVLKDEIVSATADEFVLRNGVHIAILTGDHTATRGFTLLCAICDEAAFLATSEEARVRSDSELVRALEPGLGTTGGPLIVISSPYARKGWCWRTYKRDWGNDAGRTLVWNAPTVQMNPTFDPQIVADAMAEDPQSAKAEYGAEFRDDVAEFVPRQIIEALVVKGRKELMPRHRIDYSAFVDVSGGRSDDAALAIAHRDGGKVVIDLLRQYRPPHNPHEVVRLMAEELRKYGVRRVTGDAYSAEWVARAFQSLGIRYQQSPKNKSALYLEALPRLCSGEVELLDDERLVNQLASLERRTRSGGRDVIDHPRDQHDDAANVVAGVCEVTGKPKVFVGGFGGDVEQGRRRLAELVAAQGEAHV